MYAVAITSNSGVIGKARQYPYYRAALYKTRENKRGEIIWESTGIYGPARRGEGVLKKDCQELARKYKCKIYGHGSLHNTRLKCQQL